MLTALKSFITVVIVPPANMPVFKLRLSMGFLLFCLGLGGGLLSGAALAVGTHADYWMTKAHHRVMAARLASLSRAMELTKRDLENAREADRKVRELLAMPGRGAIIETGGLGGPGLEDDRAIHENLRELRYESMRRVSSLREIEDFIQGKRAVFRATPAGWPSRGRLSSSFGYRLSPFTREQSAGESEFHPGLDIVSASGAPIVATADGVVERAGWLGGYGRMVLIRHGKGFATLYAHASVTVVQSGDVVRRGQVIASMGTTGHSTGDHLHYEVWKDGKRVDPRAYLGQALQ
ncbi:MAG: M23 family metallopeptidase [Elusimicrobia bacterium]|nr:M23 family metallopeptidase [Elusimicrobiota bacterium]